jgi:hypothetical protein
MLPISNSLGMVGERLAIYAIIQAENRGKWVSWIGHRTKMKSGFKIARVKTENDLGTLGFGVGRGIEGKEGGTHAGIQPSRRGTPGWKARRAVPAIKDGTVRPELAPERFS